jgi:hypothetical protein
MRYDYANSKANNILSKINECWWRALAA